MTFSHENFYFISFVVCKLISQNKIKYPFLTLLMTILHNSSQDETIPGQGDGHRAMEAVDALDFGDGRGDCWRDDDEDNASVGIGIGIGVGPDSGGNDGNCTLSFQPRGEGSRGRAVSHDDNRRGDCWRDNKDNGAGVRICIGIGPNSGGDNGDCASSLRPRGGGSRGRAACHHDKPRVAGRLQMTTMLLVATRACG